MRKNQIWIMNIFFAGSVLWFKKYYSRILFFSPKKLDWYLWVESFFLMDLRPVLMTPRFIRSKFEKLSHTDQFRTHLYEQGGGEINKNWLQAWFLLILGTIFTIFICSFHGVKLDSKPCIWNERGYRVRMTRISHKLIFHRNYFSLH